MISTEPASGSIGSFWRKRLSHWEEHATGVKTRLWGRCAVPLHLLLNYIYRKEQDRMRVQRDWDPELSGPGPLPVSVARTQILNLLS